jgi:hypothetical protein
VSPRINIKTHKKAIRLESFDKDLIRRKMFDACAKKRRNVQH